MRLTAPLEVGFCVADFSRSLRFWRDTLELTLISVLETDELSAVASGFALSAYQVVRLQLPTGERVKLFRPARAADSSQSTTYPPLTRSGFAFVTLIVEDLASTETRLSAEGFALRGPIHELRPGVFVGLVDGPDGELVELVQYVDASEYREQRIPMAKGV